MLSQGPLGGDSKRFQALPFFNHVFYPHGTILVFSTAGGDWSMMLIPQELEGFNVNDAVARMLDRPELWWQAVGFFVQHFSGWKEVWLESAGNDPAERRCVHAIRSAAANVGAMHLSVLAERLEKILLQRIAGEDACVPANLRADLAAAFDQAWGDANAAWREAGCELPEQL